ncbi:hypothetical protein FVEN_g12512 [Fusarium venenatum]|nr:hypothetical protein FVEN_g12512 [Fusarium venenatum]
MERLPSQSRSFESATGLGSAWSIPEQSVERINIFLRERLTIRSATAGRLSTISFCFIHVETRYLTLASQRNGTELHSYVSSD